MTRTHASGYRIGAATRTSDGKRGTVRALVVDPHTRAVTRIAVNPPHRHHRARLVPVAMTTAEPTGEVRLAPNLVVGQRQPGHAIVDSIRRHFGQRIDHPKALRSVLEHALLPQQ